MCESFLRFDLPEGSRHHEDVNPADTGVDFEVASLPPIWLEVKNWEAPVIPPVHRPKVDLDYANKTNSTSTFWDSLVAKFEGTHDCLVSRGELPKDVRLAVMLESRLFSRVALAPAISILEARIAGSRKIHEFPVGVVNAQGIGLISASFSAAMCSVTRYPHCACMAPVARCSAMRRLHSQG